MATIVGETLKPSSGSIRAVIGSTMAMTARDGSARQRLAELTAKVVCLPVWPMYRPIGIAIAIAMISDTAEMAMCSVSRTGMPFGPVQWAGSVSHATVWLM